MQVKDGGDNVEYEKQGRVFGDIVLETTTHGCERDEKQQCCTILFYTISRTMGNQMDGLTTVVASSKSESHAAGKL